MKIFNFGSLNIDYVFNVDHIVIPGETISSSGYNIYAGGKGNNQSVAIARAGGNVIHFGKVGKDGLWIIEDMKKEGVDTSSIIITNKLSGNAIIQVDKNGENSIILYGGTNKEITNNEIDNVLRKCKKDDIALIQNEISNIPYIIQKAYEAGIKICFNPAPIGDEVFSYPLDFVDIFIINEIEGASLTGEKNPEKIIKKMLLKYPDSKVILTLGERGVLYLDKNNRYEIKGLSVDVVDTTAAGDTFIGYFLTGLQEMLTILESLNLANRAASISVTRKGAVPSIPYRTEME